MKKVSVYSRVWRTLRRLERFETEVSASEHGTLIADVPPDDTILGVYRNPAIDSSRDVLISDQGLRWLSGGRVVFVPYAAISKADIDEGKHEARTIKLQLSNGEVERLPVEGGKGKLRDAWEVLRFLGRVLGDARECEPGPKHAD